MQQIIINTPINSGQGDSLKLAMDKINTNFSELYSGISITGTSQLINDSGFITIDEVPTEYAMSAITGLNSALASISSNISSLSATTNTNSQDILTFQGDINSINATIGVINTTLNAQALLISAMQQQINDLYNQL
jgi:chromosome segregation ATPase